MSLFLVKRSNLLSLTGDIHKIINIHNSEEAHYENKNYSGSTNVDFVV
jgi:hypothetical protein